MKVNDQKLFEDIGRIFNPIHLQKALSMLNKRERIVIKNRYAKNPMTFLEIGKLVPRNQNQKGQYLQPYKANPNKVFYLDSAYTQIVYKNKITLGVSHCQCRQINAQALRKLRKWLPIIESGKDEFLVKSAKRLYLKRRVK